MNISGKKNSLAEEKWSQGEVYQKQIFPGMHFSIADC